VKPAAPDRLPPHALEAEQGVLACILLAPREGGDVCLAGGVTRAWFYDVRHQTLWDCLSDMLAQPEGLIDLVTVGQRLKDAGQLEAVGGWAYLSSLMDAVPSAANVGHYLAIVREKWLLRWLIQEATMAISKAYDDEEPAEVIGGLAREVEELLVASVAQKAEPSLAAHVQALLNVLEHGQVKPGAASLDLGFPTLDKPPGILQAGNLCLVGARPSVGKTTLALNIARHVAVDLGQPVGFLSLEMTVPQLVERLVFAHTGLSRAEFGDPNQRVVCHGQNLGTLTRAPLYVRECGDARMSGIAAQCRLLVRQQKVALLVVDYFNLVQPDRKRFKRYEEASDNSQMFKALAKSGGVPLLVCAQLNRESTKDNRPPRMDDLRDCGKLEEDAHAIILLHHETRDDDVVIRETHANLVKHRGGDTGETVLRFNRPLCRFEQP
jgi:replicative DNA helicase